MTRVLVDADYLVYASGFAVEKRRYDVTVWREDGTVGTVILDSMDEVKAWLSDETGPHQIDKLVEAEPLNHATHLINRTLQTVDSRLTELGVEFDQLELVITGAGNFRDELATIKPYKGNRDPDHKPVHYKSLRRYLISRWGARVIDGREADDELAIAAHSVNYDPDSLIMVSIDKDLRTVPGRHYHTRRKVLEIVTPDEAMVAFYRQLITGDATDNIGGAFKAGPKMASEIIVGYPEKAYYDFAVRVYEEGRGKKGCPYQHLSAEDALLENARLLHLQRYPGEVWVPPGERLKPGAIVPVSKLP